MSGEQVHDVLARDIRDSLSLTHLGVGEAVDDLPRPDSTVPHGDDSLTMGGDFGGAYVAEGCRRYCVMVVLLVLDARG